VYMALEQDENRIVVTETDYYAAGMIFYNLCGYDNFGAMFGMKAGVFPEIKGDPREKLLEIAFGMMSSDPS